MFSIKSLIQFSIMASVALLPIAHLKAVIFGIPIYSVEVPISIASLAYVYGLWQGVFSPWCAINFRNPFVIGITLFFLGALASFLVNPFSLTGIGMLKTWFIFPTLALWLWLESQPDDVDLRRLFSVWLGVCVLVACASLIYFFQGMLMYDGRLAAWYASPNSLAFFLAPGILLASYFLSLPSFWQRQFFIPLGLAFAILIIAIFFTGSYTAWASIFVTLSLFFYLGAPKFTSWRKKILFLVLFVGLFLIFIFWEVGSEKWQSFVTFSERSSLASRIMIWRAAISILYDNPLWGIGLGRFQEMYLAYQKYFPLYLEWAVPQPHNLYLALWLQTGLLGLAGFIFLVSVWLKKMLILWRLSVQDDHIKKISALFIALMALFLLLGLADTPFFKTDLAFIFWFILALGIDFLNHRSIR